MAQILLRSCPYLVSRNLCQILCEEFNGGLWSPLRDATAKVKTLLVVLSLSCNHSVEIQEFFTPQIFREIKFGILIGFSITAISNSFRCPDFTWNQFWRILRVYNCLFSILEASIVNLVNFSLQKVQKWLKIKIHGLLNYGFW